MFLRHSLSYTFEGKSVCFLAAPALNVSIRSEGCEDPGRTPPCGIAYIKVNGKDYSPHLRGHNVVVSSLTGNKDGAEYSVVIF